MVNVGALLIAIFSLGFAVLMGWIAVRVGQSTFAVTENVETSEKHWTRFAGVLGGITFMSAAVSLALGGSLKSLQKAVIDSDPVLSRPATV